jgi:MFS family permease
MFITPFIPSPPLFIFVTFLFGIGHGTVLPTLQNLIVSTAPMENRAIVMAAYGSLIRIGQTTGPIVAALSALHSLSMVFLVSALIALAFSIAYNFFKV